MNLARSLAFAALAAAIAGSPLTAVAKDTATSPQQARLEAAERQLAAEASATKGAPQQEILMQKQRVDALINDLESGRRVDPSEIDAALQESNRIP